VKTVTCVPTLVVAHWQEAHTKVAQTGQNRMVDVQQNLAVVVFQVAEEPMAYQKL